VMCDFARPQNAASNEAIKESSKSPSNRRRMRECAENSGFETRPVVARAFPARNSSQRSDQAGEHSLFALLCAGLLTPHRENRRCARVS
jgi:hypothetical protein